MIYIGIDQCSIEHRITLYYLKSKIISNISNNFDLKLIRKVYEPNICITCEVSIGAKLAERSDRKFRDNSNDRSKQLLGFSLLLIYQFRSIGITHNPTTN